MIITISSPYNFRESDNMSSIFVGIMINVYVGYSTGGRTRNAASIYIISVSVKLVPK